LARAAERLDKEYVSGRPKNGPELLNADIILFQTWAYRVGKGWYGFSLGHIPRAWAEFLNDFLFWVESQCPDFEIRQIKMKVGRLKCHLLLNCGDEIVRKNVQSEISKLEALLRHKNLVC
jgi:hypothetical protein